MSLASRLYRGEVSYDFIGHRKRWYTISAVFILICIISMIFRGFTFGIDFKGGAEFDFPANGHTVTQARAALDGTGINVEVAQSLSSSPPSIRIQTKPITEAQSEKVISILQTKFNTRNVNSTSFGASWGSSVTTKSVEGLIVFLVLVMIYISLRFEPKMAAAAIVALLHDLIVTAGVYSLVGFEVTPATVIAVLTILGFSLYDTVVVFDKVRENTAGLVLAGKKTYTQAANEAVNQTLMRSINTSLIALLPVASLLFIGAGILGAGTLKDLALAQLVGLASGAYSSIFVATPLLVDFKEREPQMKQLRAKIARSQAAEVAREARSERTSKQATEPARTARATVVMNKPDQATQLDAAVPDADVADGEISAPAATPVRAGVGGAPRRPAKRGGRGRPSGKKRR
ncbi:MAG TPA: protein translocase subunit SecF [Frankiaceae bacterium]|jgi:preprotein translocase subunit SecF|nr:protein translocase subunit SecF [Frankiaceae bacterium]